MSTYGANYAPGKVAIGICARCALKMPYKKLRADGDKGPGLRVCDDDCDKLDPWRLPARPADAMVLRYPRPDVSIATHPSALTGEDNNSFVIGEDDETYVKPDSGS